MSASVPFTSEQRAAIEHAGGLLLTANAGSGKTSVMAERFVRAVLHEGVEVTRILAITFTEKAASELKERVRRRFEALGEPERARATEGAWVSTIHGFCARLLRTHPLAAGIDPRFSVLDEHGARQLAVGAFDAALDALAEEHGTAALELIAAYRPADLRSAILDVHGELRSRGEEQPSLPQPRPAALEPKRVALAIARVQAEAEVAVARDGRSVFRARLALAECERLLERVAAASAGDPGYAPSPGEVARLALPRNGRALAGEGCEGYRTALQAYVDACADAHAVPVHGLLDALLRGFGRRYAEAKQRASAVDFEDLELRANRLLREHEELRARYAERFVHVMVDEFQDTNPLQLELLERIAGERLFTVGDELQSIYGFRHADVELFRRRRKALAEHGAAASLATNFRSHAEILETLNVAFAPRFGESFTPLVAGREERADALPVAGPRVELLVVDVRADWANAGLLPEGMAAPAPLWRVAEARALAARVRELLDGGRRAGDVVLLLRATGDLAVYERALTDLAVPTYVIGGRGYWAQQQVRDLVAYLGVLANPRDGVALQSLLASPLVGLSSDGLVQVVAAARASRREGEPPDPWWVLTEGRELLARLAPDDAERVEELRAWLPAERATAPRHSLESLLDRVLDQTGYDVELLRLPSGARRLANVRKLMRLAREFEAEEGRDLRGFVDMVMELGGGLESSREQDRESEAPVEGEALDAVRLMTIHRAKGLEFPVVCVADLGRGSPAAGSDVVRVGRDGRVGIKLKTLDGSAPRPALAYRPIGEARARAESDEEARLYYVAMTRAREQLILSGAVPTEPWPEPKLGAPAITWIGPAFVPEIARLAAPDGEPSGVVSNEGQAVAYSVVRPGAAALAPSLAGSEGDRGRVLSHARERTPAGRRAHVRARATRPIGDGGGTAPPVATLSYTSLADHARCGYRFYLERVLRLPPVDDAPRGRGGRHGLAASTRGVIAHALLEQVDFVRAQPPDAELVRRAAVRAGADPTAEELDEIRGLVVRFLASPLRERLASARDLRREQAFSFALDELPLVGVFDAIAREGNRTLIVDWKSDRLEGADPGETVARAYGLQRAAYALAALRDDAQEVEVVHCFLERPDAPVGATFRRQDAPALEDELRSRAQRVIERDFAVAEDPQPRVCDGCPGRGTLCSWPLERTFGVPEGRLL
ncbi:UvrD-helicase domain-containing protein [Conexibacter woesei]|uniref:DNA 3'-5' helicase n=1 Tax=Conexibacter woesei (strain DSM 14684 / CCUG 47730 / CIP 108061 / JCM 11494 / NBRC 100937 / ID131577) TaxID=469383 RepID=D3F256_CONWI|nr:UvrD-helicase domain-containing protein [Conexibacter woesei]ADB50231.1 UvrD/REP helicase [Conexibacter woesei DSM 14684]